MTGPLKMTLVGDKSFLKRHLENRSLEDEPPKDDFPKNDPFSEYSNLWKEFFGRWG
jgi:hypothetical protein